MNPDDIVDDAKKFLGLDPYNQPSNTSLNDPYFELHCEKTYGAKLWDETIQKLKTK